MKYKKEDFPSLEEVSENVGYEFDRDGDEVTVTKCNGYEEEIFVPYGVTQISEAAFKGYDYGPYVTEDEDYGTHDLESVIIPPTVKAIGPDAFADCDCLQRIYIPASVISIAGNPFSALQDNSTGSPDLQIIEVEEGNPRYRSEDGCLIDTYENLLICGGVDAKIPSGGSICKIGAEAFLGRNVEEVAIPEGVTEIGESAFSDCKELKKVTLPSTLTKICRYAFAHCQSLEEIILPDGIEEIENGAFTGCSSLSEMVWSENIDEIKSVTFSNCLSLRKIILPKNLKHIGKSAFFGSGLKEIELPEGLKFIDSDAFTQSAIESITIPPKCACGSKLFYRCRHLKKFTVPKGWKEIPTQFFQESGIEEVEIPDSVEKIGIHAFAFCYSLKKINLPESLKIIKDQAFAHSGLEELKIPSGVTEIEYAAFEFCDKLKTVFIPKNIKEIGHSLFFACKSLTSVTIEDGITKIGEHAFSSCKKLESVYIPDSVITIDEYAFGECKALKAVTVPRRTKIAGDAFEECGVQEIDELDLMDMSEREYEKLMKAQAKIKIKITRR